ncbi:MAG: hypothetical protein ACOYO1_15670 [Bacteroidales bacterium]
MQTINKNSEKLAGVVDLYAIPCSNVKKIENKQIFCSDINEIYQFICASESIAHNYTSENKESGQLFVNKVTAYMPGLDINIDKLFNKLKQYKFVVVIRNQDSQYIMIGDNQIGLVFEWNYVNTSNWSGSVGYELKFETNASSPHKLVNLPFVIV